MAAARRRFLALCQRRCRYGLLVFAPSAALVLLVTGTLAQGARQAALVDLRLRQTHAVDLAIQALTAHLDLAEQDLLVLERWPELQRMLVTSIDHDGPCAIRIPRGEGEGVHYGEEVSFASAKQRSSYLSTYMAPDLPAQNHSSSTSKRRAGLPPSTLPKVQDEVKIIQPAGVEQRFPWRTAPWVLAGVGLAWYGAAAKSFKPWASLAVVGLAALLLQSHPFRLRGALRREQG